MKNLELDSNERPYEISSDEGVLQLVQKAVADLNHPFYYYDLDALKTHFEKVFEEAKGIATLWYATKANPISAILSLAYDCGFNLDVASPGELAQVQRSGVSAQRILVTGPAKSKNLMKRYLEAGVETFVLESHNQVIWLNEMAAQLGKKPDALLRLQIRWDEKESSVLGGNAITPFGLVHDEWLKLQLKDYQHINFMGVHSFQWGNILDEERLLTIWERVLQRCLALSKAMKLDLKVVDLGGGVGIPYKDQEREVNWPKLMKGLESVKKKHGSPTIWLELGRYMVGAFGAYVTKIIDEKQVEDKNILVLDSGINQLARPTLTKQSFPCESLFKKGTVKTSKQIHGPLCTALDQLGTYDLEKETSVGDWLIFRQCGAYGFTESMPYFLCHSLPGEAIISQGKLTMVRMPRPANHYLV